jgi:hypothetical protein
VYQGIGDTAQHQPKKPLNIAVKEGLVTKVKGSYHFLHDWLLYQ